jgi:ribosomal protein S18 acetylase RimI-like enzyme
MLTGRHPKVKVNREGCMNIEILPGRAEFAAQFRECLDSVAKEERFLLFVDAPPLSALADDLKNFTDTNSPNFFAFDDSKLIGWCDLRLTLSEPTKHRAEIGMGLMKEYRGKGIGRALLEKLISAAPDRGLEKLELVVLADNESAIQLYKSVGFKEEGRILNYRKLNGVYTDAINMGLLLV